MLVLRRRPDEAIVFDGGLMLTLVSVTGRIAWLRFSDSKLATPVLLGLPSAAGERAELSIGSPVSISSTAERTLVELSPPSAPDPGAVLTLTRGPGEVVEVGGLRLVVSTIEDERLYLELSTPSLPSTVTLSIVTVSTVDARIGVNAPSELRVYRKEVLDEMQAANTAAAGEWSSEDLAALTVEKP